MNPTAQSPRSLAASRNCLAIGAIDDRLESGITALEVSLNSSSRIDRVVSRPYLAAMYPLPSDLSAVGGAPRSRGTVLLTSPPRSISVTRDREKSRMATVESLVGAPSAIIANSPGPLPREPTRQTSSPSNVNAAMFACFGSSTMTSESQRNACDGAHKRVSRAAERILPKVSQSAGTILRVAWEAEVSSCALSPLPSQLHRIHTTRRRCACCTSRCPVLGIVDSAFALGFNLPSQAAGQFQP